MPQETDAEKISRLERENESLRREVERLRRLLEEALRAGKRQAAPFSRRHPKAHPARPGRKPGTDYGRRCRRPVPPRIDEVVEVPLPGRCPHCGSGVKETGVVSQYQTEIPAPRVERVEFRIHVGRCRRCRWPVQGRHPRQTSQAVGSAASQLGPRALALATVLNKQLGLPYGKTAAVLEQGWGLKVSRSGLCQAFQRLAQKAEPTYRALVERIRAAPSVTADETGWKVAACLQWMWVFSSPQVTVYAIQPGRGYEQAAAVLGEDFSGFLVRDGWSVYRQFAQAMHQTCLAHLLRRCREMIEVGGSHAAQFPRALQKIFQSALRLRERRDQGQLSEHGLAVARGQLESRMDRLLSKPRHSPQNQRLANHSMARTRCAVHVLVLFRPGSHQLARRTGHSPDGRYPQGVGRKSHPGRRTHTKHLAQRSPNLSPAESACLTAAHTPALFASAADLES